MTEDRRVAAAREYAEKYHDGGVRLVLTELLAYGEERLRVNLGLMQENATLKKRTTTESDTIDLEAVSDDLLLSEVKRRFR